MKLLLQLLFVVALTMEAGATIEILRPQDIVSAEVKTPSISLLHIEASSEALAANLTTDSAIEATPSSTVTINDNKSSVDVTVHIVFDENPEEIGWMIENVREGEIAASRPVGIYGEEAGVDGVEEIFPLPKGMYMFGIEDSAGDGFSRRGILTLSVEGIQVASVEGNFGSYEFISFDIP